MSKVCNCPHPPGGSIECEEDQLGICGVVDGRAKRACVKVANLSGLDLVNWAINEITQSIRSSRSAIKTVDIEMLNNGSYSNSAGEIVTFSLPQSIKDAVREVEENDDNEMLFS